MHTSSRVCPLIIHLARIFVLFSFHGNFRFSFYLVFVFKITIVIIIVFVNENTIFFVFIEFPLTKISPDEASYSMKFNASFQVFGIHINSI